MNGFSDEFFGPGFDSNATYSFGTPSGSAVGSTLTETITSGQRSATITYSETVAATATAPAEFVILPSWHGATAPTTPTYSFVTAADGTVTETISGTARVETLTYVGGLLSDDLVAFSAPASGQPSVTYSFGTSSSGAAQITETETHGSSSHSFTESAPPLTVYAATTGGETATSAAGNSIQTITYTDVSGSTTATTLTSINTQFVAQGTASTALDIIAGERAEFAFGASSTVVTPVGYDGTLFKSYTPSSGTSITLVSPASVPAALPASGSFALETTTHGSHSNSALFYSASGSGGIYTEVAHGSSIDVTGVATQLASLPAALISLL